MKKATFLAFKIMTIAPAILFILSCNPIEDESRSSSLLTVESITGSDMNGNEVNFLQSDILYVDPTTGAPLIIADTATATLRAELLDPASPTGPSVYNHIKVNRYVVSYFRADGKNTEGVDVPYSFEGNLTVLVEVGSSVDVSFVIVREVAKNEPPLVNLVEGRGEGVLEITAKVDFYGQDLGNKNVKASGYLTIFFANYSNE